MRQFFQQLVNGTVLGATYGLIALGYTMVYGIIQLINFAHGEVFMVGAFAGLSAHRWLLPDALTGNAFVALPVMVLVAVVVAVLTAVLMERLAYRPLRNVPRLAPLITAIGVSICLQELIRIFFPSGNWPQPFPTVITTGAFEVGGVRIAWVSVFVVVTAIVAMVALQAFVRKTKTGKAMRATAQDPDTARLMGIDTNRVIVITFALGAALAAIGGGVVRDALRPDRLPHRLRHRAQGVHRRRPGGHRQHVGGHARRLRPGDGRGDGRGVHPARLRLAGRVGVRGAHPGPGLPSRRPPRRTGDESLVMLRSGVTASALDRLRQAAGPVVAGVVGRLPPVPAVGAGAALLVAGSLTPWATFPGFPGKTSLAGFPGGARQFTLALAAAAVLVVVRLPGRRAAGMAAGAAALAVAAYNVVAVSGEGGGLGGVAYGAWLAVAGGALLLLGMAALPVAGERAVPDGWPPRPAPVEWLAVVAAVGAVLYLTVWGLAIEESSRFVSWVVFVIGASLALSRLGLFSWLEELVGPAPGHRPGGSGGGVAGLPVHPGGGRLLDPGLRLHRRVRGRRPRPERGRRTGRPPRPGLHRLLRRGRLRGGAAGELQPDDRPRPPALLPGRAPRRDHRGCFGVLLGAPTLRLRGDYLAIVTLGFGEIFRIAAFNRTG